MSVGTLTNNFVVLDSANVNLIRADSVETTNTAPTKQVELDLTATVGGVSLTLSTYGFATSAQCYIYNSGAIDATITQGSTTLKVTIPAGKAAFIPYLLTTAATFTTASSTTTLYVLIDGS